MSYTGFKANNSNYPTETDLAQIFVPYQSPEGQTFPTGFVVNNDNYPTNSDFNQLFEPYNSGFYAPITGFIVNNEWYQNQDVANLFQYKYSVPFDFSNSPSSNYSGPTYISINSVTYGIIKFKYGTFNFTTTADVNIVQIFLVGGGGMGGSGGKASQKTSDIGYASIGRIGGGGGGGGGYATVSGVYESNTSFVISVGKGANLNTYAQSTYCIINNIKTTAKGGGNGQSGYDLGSGGSSGNHNLSSYGGTGGLTGYRPIPGGNGFYSVNAQKGYNGIINNYTGLHYCAGGGGGGFGGFYNAPISGTIQGIGGFGNTGGLGNGGGGGGGGGLQVSGGNSANSINSNENSSRLPSGKYLLISLSSITL